jgi:hypothetical protein
MGPAPEQKNHCDHIAEVQTEQRIMTETEIKNNKVLQP